MFETLQKLQVGVTSLLDTAFGEWIANRSDEACGLAAALASAEVGKGHVCLDLETAAQTLRTQGISVPGNWREALADSNVVADTDERAPLVLVGDRLYLHRYWTYETRIAEKLHNLATSAANFDVKELKKALNQQFPAAGKGELDRQALAAAIGATRRLTIISGGPGTGKTWTVFKLIAVAFALDPNLNVVLAAPTGKAAGRLGEVMAKEAGPLPPDLRERLPDKPLTLHRLLGYNAATQRIRHDADNPLDADLIVVDEASMVDIGLMARLLAALKPDARLVLVGDRNQLASVEAGAVFGDICAVAAGFPEPAAAALEAALGAPVPRAEANASAVSSSIALLKRNYRFKRKDDSSPEPIGELAHAIVAGDPEAAFSLLKSQTLSPHTVKAESSSPSATGETTKYSSPSPLAGEGRGEGNDGEAAAKALTWRQITNERQLSRELSRIAKTWFQPISNATTPKEALAQLTRFRLLAAERHGPFGVEGLNERIEALLGVRRNDPWYQGRPILITENDYEIDLFNGDFGIIWPDESGRALLRVAGADGELRSLSPARLPAHETCYALTVHKAQGSEFNRIALVLPPRESRVATRELVYTGITRAREAVEVWATEAALRTAIATPIRRASGLAARLGL